VRGTVDQIATAANATKTLPPSISMNVSAKSCIHIQHHSSVGTLAQKLEASSAKHFGDV
jgi:hypothetical protein